MLSGAGRDLRGVLLDLDGTLYVDGEVLPGAPRLLHALNARGLAWACLTNNSSRSTAAYAQRLREMGLGAAAERVITSGQATIRFLLQHTPHRSAYLVGTASLAQEFAAAGVVLDERDPDCVVVAYDTTVDYPKLCAATRLLLAGKPYYATHADRTCISREGLLPDIAATIAGLQAVTGREPLVIGKPEPPIVAIALAQLGLRAEQVAMVGDQLDTDMTMARRCGMVAVLVLSGETTAEQLAQSPLQPDLVVSEVGALADRLLGA